VGRAPCRSAEGGRDICMSDMCVLKEMWAQGKMYIWEGTLFDLNVVCFIL
jgi:hypothetical protein